MMRHGIRFSRYLDDNEKALLDLFTKAESVKVQAISTRASTITIWCPKHIKDVMRWQNSLAVVLGERFIASEIVTEPIPD